MKIYIDDERKIPWPTRDDWFVHRCKRSLRKAVTYYVEKVSNDVVLKAWMEVPMSWITHISFDHDLWDDSVATWYDLLKWTIESYLLAWVELPKITIHSANPIGKERMERLLEEYEQRK